MAHAANLSHLAGDLVTSITGTKTGDAGFQQIHDRTLKGLKNASHARTNQFDVQSRLAGLVEKFAVRNRDDLSEGLQTRLDELPPRSQWLPEILSLLLELSDRPLEKTRIEDVEALGRAQDEEAPLTWEDIIADDPLDEPDVWDDVERGYHSSDDDFTEEESGSGDDTQATSIVEDDPVALARMHVLQIDDSALSEVKQVHAHLEKAVDGGSVSELTWIRESLAMLHGLPTAVYNFDSSNGRVSLRKGVSLSTTSVRVLEDVLQGLAHIGSSLNKLRTWIKSKQQAPTLRSCQAALEDEMKAFASQLAVIEQRYIGPGECSVTSIISVRSELERIARPQEVAARLTSSEGRHTATTILDSLYGETCTAQLSGDLETFSILSRTLFAGLKSYLRPVARWIVAGELSKDDQDFFVVEANANCELGRLWHDRYALREHAVGEPTAPTFLEPFVDRIFALGKGRAFMRSLDSNNDDYKSDDTATLRDLELGHSHSSDLLPFSSLLSDALEHFITSCSKDQTHLLLHRILHDHGLLQHVDNLQNVYFSRNGRRFQTFADTVFWRLDHSSAVRGWDSAFLLTELAQTTIGSDTEVSAESLTVQVATPSENSDDARATSSIRRLETVQLTYHTPWPLKNITKSVSSPTNSKAFTFLLQIYRAKYLLRGHLFTLRNPDTRTPALPARVQMTLRLQQKLTAVVDVLHAHVAYTAQLLGAELKRQLMEAEDLDALATIWQRHEMGLGVSLLVGEKLGTVRGAVVGVLEAAEKLAGEGFTDEEGDDNMDVRALQVEVDKALAFVTAGLRGVGRAGGNAALEALGERMGSSLSPQWQ